MGFTMTQVFDFKILQTSHDLPGRDHTLDLEQIRHCHFRVIKINDELSKRNQIADLRKRCVFHYQKEIQLATFSIEFKKSRYFYEHNIV